jgi:hypothetical protein
MLKEKHEPKNSTIVSKDVVHINGQSYDDTNTGPNLNNISKGNQKHTKKMNHKFRFSNSDFYNTTN